jgi:hypothetical protein
MKLSQQGRMVLLLVSSLLAQKTAPVRVERVDVVRESGVVAVKVMLSAPIKPSIETAVHPDRLVMVLRNAVPATKRELAFNEDGTQTVHLDVVSGESPIIRIVIDLNGTTPYSLEARGNELLLKIREEKGLAHSNPHRTPPAAASGATITGIFHKQSKQDPETTANVAAPVLLPPAPFPPINSPSGTPLDTANSTGEANRNDATSAAQPSRGSLQQGIVYPEMGTPGTGAVPPAANVGTPTAAGTVSATTSGSAIPVAEAVANATVNSSNTPPAAPNGSEVQSRQIAETVVEQRPQDASGGASTISAAGPPTQNSSSSATSSEEAARPSPDATASSGVATRAADSWNSLPTPGNATQTAAAPESPDPDDPALKLRAANQDLRLAFKVKYVAQDAAYLDGGRSAGLGEGMRLVVRESTSSPTSPNADASAVVAELEVISVADTSSVTSIHQVSRDVKPGDYAYLSSEDQEALVAKNALSATRIYPAVISFTEGDPLDEEAREEVPRPPLPSVNRARGRIGFDYMGTVTHGPNGTMGSDLGMVMRTDITRIGGTFWNISGYWRGRFSSQQVTGQPTLQDLINRTYHLKMTYDNPQSAWVAGFGRMYLPWASSLDTIDGGYFGRRVSHGATVGMFAGSTPDPTSWNYNPGRLISGAFINFEGGSFDNLHYTSTTGGGISMINWNVDKPFIFFENTLSYKRYLTIYHSLQADSPSGNQETPAPGPGIGRSFLTVRWQPMPRLEFDFNHTYFRDVPTFDPSLIGTGLLDKYLFQGFSGGARVEVVKHIWVYTDLGQSNHSGDTRNSGNQAYGITLEQLPKLKLRTDFHYSRFSSSFGDGSYRAVSIGRNLNDSLHLEVLLGDQSYSSSYSTNNRSRFVNANFDVNLGAHYFVQTGLTINRGNTQSYDQWFTTFGYRFDSFHRSRK